MAVQPYTISVSDDTLTDLRRSLAQRNGGQVC